MILVVVNALEEVLYLTSGEVLLFVLWDIRVFELRFRFLVSKGHGSYVKTLLGP